MRTLNDIPIKNAFPAVYWRKGEMYRAKEPLELYAGSRSMFGKLVDESKAGEWHLMDAQGRYFDIRDWERIEPFGGFKSLPHRLMRCVFAAPILTNERQLTLDEFKITLEHVARERYRYDIEPYELGDIRAKLPQAQSYLEALGALPPLM